MKNLSFILFLGLVLSFSVSAACDPTEKRQEYGNQVEFQSAYGKSLSLSESHHIDEVITKYDSLAGSPLQVKARVATVCKNKGCWMALESEANENVRVRFEDYAYFVSMALVGKEVLIEGRLNRELISTELLQHYGEDEGLSAEKVAQLNMPAYEYSFLASGVQVIDQ